MASPNTIALRYAQAGLHPTVEVVVCEPPKPRRGRRSTYRRMGMQRKRILRAYRLAAQQQVQP